MTQYTHTTLFELRGRLAALLGDPDTVFWTSAELDLYIAEALRWWGLSSMYFRQTAKFETVAGQSFYDLPSVLETLAGVPIQSFTLTDRDIITDITYAIMEPPIVMWAGGWIGTEMFTLGEISSTLQYSRDEFLKLTGMLTNEVNDSSIVPEQSRVELTDREIQIVRASWNNVESPGPLPMWATDSIQDQTTFVSSWRPGTGRPTAFSVNYTPQLSVDLWPKPIDAGTIHFHTVQSGSPFAPTITATPLGVPDDASWILKYRTMEDILSGDGLSRSWKLSQYCHERVIDAFASLGTYESILWGEVNGRRIPITSLSQLDQVRPRWEQSSGRPKSVAQLSWNHIALFPVPDDIYRITLDVTYQAPIPTADGDFIPVGRESLQAILDYAQHAASFKMQGGEFDATVALYQSAAEQARDYRAQMLAQARIGGRQTAWQTRMDRWTRPYRARSLSEDLAKEVAS